MYNKNYLSYLYGTIENYPKKIKESLIKLFIEKNIAYEELPLIKTEDTSGVNVTGLDLLDKLESCLNKSMDAICLYEEWEFLKDYRYSILFTCDDYDKLTEHCKKARLFNSTMSFDLYDKVELPIRYELSDYLFLKFNLKYDAIHPQTGEKLFIKYPVIVVLHLKEGLIEFRFDTLKNFFLPTGREQYFYIDLIKQIELFIKTKYYVDILPLDLRFIIEESRSNTEVNFVAQYMKLSNGGSAQLEVGNNEEYILPFIGELKSIMTEYQEEFDKNPKIKNILEQFIKEKEETSDYPWVEIMWKDKIQKSKNFQVKFTFDYTNQDNYSLLQHQFNGVLVGMERMNHVTKYISQHRGDINKI